VPVPTPNREHRRATLCVVAIALLYLATRLALDSRFPQFWDEAFYAVEGQTAFDDATQRFAALADGKGPLLDWLSAVLVGQGFSPLAAVRTLAALAGLLTLGMVGLIGRRLGGAVVGLVAAGLYVLVPLFLVHDSVGLIDPLVAAAATSALYLQLRLAERASLGVAVALGAALGAGILAKQTGLYAIVLIPLSLLCFDWQPGARWARAARWAAGIALALVITALARAVLMLSPLYDQLAQIRAGLRQFRPFAQALSDPFALLGHNWPGFSGVLTGYVTVPVLALAALGAVLAARARWRLVVVLAAWVIVPFAAALVFVDYGYARYVLSSFPPLLPLVAFGGVHGVRLLRRRLPAPRFRIAAAVLAVLALVPALLQDARFLAHPATARYPGEDDWQFVAGWPAGTGLGPIADALRQRAHPGLNTVAWVFYPPWGLAVELDHPRRVPEPPSPPFLDAFVARGSAGRTFRFVRAGTPAAQRADFVLQHDVFGLPRGVSLAGYRLVAAFRRPHGGRVQGRRQPVTTVQLYQRG
jgi:4-amino-4-deoxy-L-arabinose transferase-like glycosyltransferase